MLCKGIYAICAFSKNDLNKDLIFEIKIMFMKTTVKKRELINILICEKFEKCDWII